MEYISYTIYGCGGPSASGFDQFVEHVFYKLCPRVLCSFQQRPLALGIPWIWMKITCTVTLINEESCIRVLKSFISDRLCREASSNDKTEGSSARPFVVHTRQYSIDLGLHTAYAVHINVENTTTPVIQKTGRWYTSSRSSPRVIVTKVYISTDQCAVRT